MERFEKFNTSRQEALRLSIALEEFCREEIPAEHRAVYIGYLHRRLRPALLTLVRQDDTLSLTALTQIVSLPAEALNDAIALAASEKRTAALVWLLRYKRETFGFADRDFSL